MLGLVPESENVTFELSLYTVPEPVQLPVLLRSQLPFVAPAQEKLLVVMGSKTATVSMLLLLPFDVVVALKVFVPGLIPEIVPTLLKILPPDSAVDHHVLAEPLRTPLLEAENVNALPELMVSSTTA